MERRRFLSLAPLLGLPLLAIGCDTGSPLRVSYHSWIGYETLDIASHFGWLPTEVALTRRSSVSASLAALRDGRADAAATTLDEVISARRTGLDLVIVMVFNVSAGADALLVREPIGSLSQLQGRRIGVESSAVGELILRRILDKAGLTRDDVTVVDMPIDQHLSAWRSGRVDALVSYEPTVAQLRREGAIRLMDSRAFPDLIFDVLAVRRDRLVDIKKPLKGLIQGHFLALDHLRFNRPDAIYRIADAESITVQDVRAALAGVRLPGLTANRRYLAPDSRLMRSAEEVLMYLYGDNDAEQRDVARWFSADFLPQGTWGESMHAL